MVLFLRGSERSTEGARWLAIVSAIQKEWPDLEGISTRVVDFLTCLARLG